MRIKMIWVKWNHCLLQIKEKKGMKTWGWEDDPKTIYESRRKNIISLNLRFKGVINISLTKKIVKVMKRLLNSQ